MENEDHSNHQSSNRSDGKIYHLYKFRNILSILHARIGDTEELDEDNDEGLDDCVD